jgi:Rrf2 family transcriptional regulator, iron-sulfur cluster assembly transcription factor
MKLSKKAEYALRAVLAMSRERAGHTFAIQEIARSESIPAKFLEQILLVLKNAGILRSKRGVGGGYQLARLPAEISLREVIELIDGAAEPLSCIAHVGKPTTCDCGVVGGCSLGRAFAELRDQLTTWLGETTFATLLERDHEQDAVMFEI